MYSITTVSFIFYTSQIEMHVWVKAMFDLIKYGPRPNDAEKVEKAENSLSDRCTVLNVSRTILFNHV